MDGDSRAFRGEREGDDASDAPPGAGDQRDFPLEAHRPACGIAAGGEDGAVGEPGAAGGCCAARAITFKSRVW